MTSEGAARPKGPAQASEATIKEDRDRLVALQAKANRIKDFQEQLQRIATLDGDGKAARHGQWRTASASNPANQAGGSKFSTDLARAEHNAATEIKDNGDVLVPLGKMAFLPGKIKPQGADKRSILLANGKLVMDEVSVRGEPSLQEAPVLGSLAQVDAERKKLETELVALRESVLATARTMLMRHLEDGKNAPPVDEKGQALNEEGLPFIDLNEPDHASNSNSKPAPQPIARDKKTKAERKAWMDKIFDDIENGGDGDVGEDEDDDPESSKTDAQERATASASAAAEKGKITNGAAQRPIKSVLKPASMPSTPIQKFGHSGVRNGFLNLNPSSPAAAHSSDPVEDIKWDEEGMSASTSSLGSAADRLSRSTDLDVKKKKKKSVRIQSPDAREWREPSGASQLSAPLQIARQSQATVRGINDKDEDTSAEAAQILDLLGTDVMKGHPDYEAIMEGKRLQDEANAAAAQRATERYAAPKQSGGSGSAIRKEVTERTSTPASTSTTPKAGDKPVSAFKRGFLNKAGTVKQPPPRVRASEQANALPAAPRISQGVSALERATKSDDVISEKRVQEGLKPSVPHARPSKAFAEKMEARKRGEKVDASTQPEAEDDEPAKMSKVRFGTNNNGAVAVKIGTAATEASGVADANEGKVAENESAVKEIFDDEDEDMSADESDSSSRDEELRAMGLEIREEELDDETVEALGYISDPDHDPDIGFDSDDLIESAPTFASDGNEITDEELRREYERTKAAVLRSQGITLRRSTGFASSGADNYYDEDEDLAAMEGTDLSLYGDDDSGAGTAKAGQSRFRRERILRAMQGQRATSRELGGRQQSSDAVSNKDAFDALSQARNVGPSMLIPSLAKVRFPKSTNGETAGQDSGINVELDGESDEEDDQLLDVMRARLEQRDFIRKQSRGEASSASRRDDEDGPPTIRPAATSKITGAAMRERSKEAPSDASAGETLAATTGSETKKKPSLFKARMQQQ